MSVYYNEIDPFAAAWLRELMKANQIPDGEVDERSIAEVSAADVRGFCQCHFFAGIGGWAYALRLAGWGQDRPVWTGSCPCQPWSMAGSGEGTTDSRDLWPTWFRLIEECRSATVFGEQVASADGRYWLDRVYVDLEGADYAVGAANLCAAGATAPHCRQRLFFVADTTGQRAGQLSIRPGRPRQAATVTVTDRDGEGDLCLANASRSRRREIARSASGDESAHGWQSDSHHVAGRHGQSDYAGLADADGRHGFWWSGPLQVGWNTIEAEIERGGRKYRAQWRIKPGLSLLAHGVSGRVGRISGFGNAIVPQVAQAFIEAYLGVA